MLKLKFTFKHMDSSEILRDYATEKSEKLTKLLKKPIDLHFFFSEEHGKTSTEVTLLADQHKFVSLGSDNKGTASIDLAIEKVISQVRKTKEKATKHH